MADPKLLTLLERLHRRTREGRVDWEETREEGVFQAHFGGLALTISSREDPEWPDSPDYVIRILNDEGRLVEEFTNNDLRPLVKDEEVNPYKLLDETFTSARRSAMGVERALNTLLEELGDAASG